MAINNNHKYIIGIYANGGILVIDSAASQTEADEKANTIALERHSKQFNQVMIFEQKSVHRANMSVQKTSV